ncbi:hypothetical protein F3Y22_tig00110015pilonHSYRG00225 [Hibiscus syriacus]|uniref:Uncharacterized protein n=1 Tax=Hibiscus syriacus TaxID=106335 RepID=A0A6A3BPS2_HIBSY|nr:hypothetical protein F3Y22_tig00110015pilonHSYRG00225 [Hibiscus syriacus]
MTTENQTEWKKIRQLTIICCRFPSTSQYQQLVSSKSSDRGKLNIVDYGHDEAVVSSEHEERELGSNDDLMFGLEHQIANVDFQGKTSPAAVQGTPESPNVEP